MDKIKEVLKYLTENIETISLEDFIKIQNGYLMMGGEEETVKEYLERDNSPEKEFKRTIPIQIEELRRITFPHKNTYYSLEKHFSRGYVLYMQAFPTKTFHMEDIALLEEGLTYLENAELDFIDIEYLLQDIYVKSIEAFNRGIEKVPVVKSNESEITLSPNGLQLNGVDIDASMETYEDILIEFITKEAIEKQIKYSLIGGFTHTIQDQYNHFMQSVSAGGKTDVSENDNSDN